MKNKMVLASLAMDLRRVALAYHRGSVRVAERFYEEASLRRKEIDETALLPYLRTVLTKFDRINRKDIDRRAEDMLTYSILFQNAATSIR